MHIRLLIKVSLALALCMAVSAQGSRTLYFVTAVPSSHGGSAVPSALWRVENNRLVRIAELPDASRDSNLVAVDHDRRVLLVATPGIQPKQFVVVNMDAPTAVRTIPIAVKSYAIASGWFLDSPKGVSFSVRSFDDENPNELKTRGIDLSTGAVTILPIASWAGVRTAGWWDPGDAFAGGLEIGVKEGKFIGILGAASFDFGVSAPRNVAQESSRLRLIISNDAMLVLDRPSLRANTPAAAAGRLQLEVYDKMAGTWRSETFKGGGSSVRAFGEWLAVNEGHFKPERSQRKPNDTESPGAANRTKVLNPRSDARDQSTVDLLFQDSDQTFDGSIELLNIRTGKRHDFYTAQGDTEVLLIDGSTLYYRVNDALFRTQIGSNNLGSPVQMLRDDNLQLVHWAFLGS
jgi:hypothetical protein